MSISDVDRKIRYEIVQECLRRLESIGMSTAIIIADDINTDNLNMVLGLNGHSYNLAILLFGGAAKIMAAIREKDPLGFSEIETTLIEEFSQGLGLDDLADQYGGHC